MTRHFIGWTPPPRPIEVPPSIDSSLSHKDMVERVLLDFKHDDDLRSAVWTRGPSTSSGGEGTNWLLNGAGAVDPYSLLKAWQNPNQFAIENGYPQGVSDLNKFLVNLHTPINKAIQKRLALGPLPPNEYGQDTVTIYYYDNDRIKKVVYPRTAISSSSGYALDPNNHFWWKGNGIITQERQGDGSWGDEGFDWNKDAEGALTTIGSIIMAIVGAILLATGVGAAAGAAILAFSAALVAEAQMIALSLTNGDWAKFFGAFVDAFTKLLGIEASQILPAGVTKATVAALNSTIKALAPFSKQLSTQNFKDAYASIQSQLNNFGPIDDHQIILIDAMLGSAKGPFDGGYEMASYADADTIDGVSQLIPDEGAKNLFKFGALLGVMRQNQKNNPQAPKSPAVQTNNANAKADLFAYVENFLAPRYGLKK